MTACPEGCGACCDPVVSVFTLDSLRGLLPFQLDANGREDRAFMLAHLTPLTRREGLTRAPYLSQGGLTFGSVDGGRTVVEMWSHFYECDLFDPVARVCTAYEDRPPMCRDYPWYGRGPDPAAALPASCAFRADVDGPTPVTITPRPRR